MPSPGGMLCTVSVKLFKYEMPMSFWAISETPLSAGGSFVNLGWRGAAWWCFSENSGEKRYFGLPRGWEILSTSQTSSSCAAFVLALWSIPTLGTACRSKEDKPTSWRLVCRVESSNQSRPTMWGWLDVTSGCHYRPWFGDLQVCEPGIAGWTEKKWHFVLPVYILLRF